MLFNTSRADPDLPPSAAGYWRPRQYVAPASPPFDYFSPKRSGKQQSSTALAQTVPAEVFVHIFEYARMVSSERLESDDPEAYLKKTYTATSYDLQEVMGSEGAAVRFVSRLGGVCRSWRAPAQTVSDCSTLAFPFLLPRADFSDFVVFFPLLLTLSGHLPQALHPPPPSPSQGHHRPRRSRQCSSRFNRYEPRRPHPRHSQTRRPTWNLRRWEARPVDLRLPQWRKSPRQADPHFARAAFRPPGDQEGRDDRRRWRELELD